ncbi:MAG: Spy/CpxP family protein refolding chaperone [Polyangiaceae bacterium]
MRKYRLFPDTSPLFAVLAGALLLPACASAPPAPPEAPPAPPPPALSTAAPAPAAPPPAPVTEAPAPEAPKPHMGHHHGMLELFTMGLDSLELTPEQKTTVDGIKADMATHSEAPKEPREQLEADVSVGVAAGKIDRAKTDADIKAMSAAVTATQPAMQDDMNRLYKALTPEQRKKLIETMREKGKQMHEHEAMDHGGMAHPGGMDHGPGHLGTKDKGDTGPGAPMHEKDHENKGAGHMEHEHEGPGPEGVLGKLTEDLGLTPEQKDKLRTKLSAQMESQHAAMKGKMLTIMKHMDAVGTAFEGDKFDAKKAGVGSDAPDMLKAIATAKVQFVETVLSVLTPEQRPKLVAHLQAHAGEMD